MEFLIPKINDFIDILLITIILYEVFVLTRRTGGYQFLLGLLVIFVLYFIAALFKLEMLYAVLRTLKNVWVIALIIVFQPEIRNVLAHVRLSKSLGSVFRKRENVFYGPLMDAVSSMSFRRMGAIIVLETNQPLDHFLDKAEKIDATISVRLLLSIFNTGSILHDGAVVIRGDRILAAKVMLPLSNKEEYLRRFGMRHMAGVGISEVSDAFVIIVSEETGKVSIAQNGKLITNVPFEELLQRTADATKS